MYMGELADLMRATQAMAQAADMPIAKTVARHAMALVNAQLREARDLPAKLPRQTRPGNGQTIEAGGAE
jgi:hypothetical protein